MSDNPTLTATRNNSEVFRVAEEEIQRSGLPAKVAVSPKDGIQTTWLQLENRGLNITDFGGDNIFVGRARAGLPQHFERKNLRPLIAEWLRGNGWKRYVQSPAQPTSEAQLQERRRRAKRIVSRLVDLPVL